MYRYKYLNWMRQRQVAKGLGINKNYSRGTKKRCHLRMVHPWRPFTFTGMHRSTRMQFCQVINIDCVKGVLTLCMWSVYELFWNFSLYLHKWGLWNMIRRVDSRRFMKNWDGTCRLRKFRRRISYWIFLSPTLTGNLLSFMHLQSHGQIELA